MIVVHHLNNSRSQRVLWMLRELEMPHEVRRYERQATMLAPPALREVHPLGKSPVIEDTETGETVAETGAIVEYLVERADGRMGPPARGPDRLRYRFWLHYAEGSLMPPLLVLLVLGRVPLMGKLAARRVRPMLDRHLDYVEAELTSRSWFAGDDVTGADVMMSFPLEAAHARGLVGEGRPAITAWLNKVHARPAYQVALEDGGPYAYA